MSATLEKLQYGFDRDSRRTWQKRALTTLQDQHYSYDALSQVSAAARGGLNLNMTAISGIPVSAQSWDYDPTGNWRGYHTSVNGTNTLDQHRIHDRGSRLTQIEDNPHNMILDRVGRMRQMAPDAEGDWNGALKLTWDAWSRITSVKNNDEVVGEYGYDGAHRRVTREAGGATLHSYYNDQWRPVEGRKNAETTASVSYLWGARHRDDLLRRDRATSGTTLDETRYVLMDYFMPAAITDEAGEVTERYSFSAFGVRTILNPDFSVRSSSECGMEFGFQGQFLDGESGLMNYGYRYYSPYLGRWPSRDPIEERGGLNLYVFAENDAVNWVDYLGLSSFGPGGMGPPQAFDSSDAAGRNALDSAKEATKASDDPNKRRLMEKRAGGPQGKYGVEYCGLICKTCIDGTVIYINTGPRTDNSRGSCNPDKAPCPDGWEKSGQYHTHPDGNSPSDDDKTRARVGDENYVGSGSTLGGDFKYTKTQQPGTGIPQNNVSSFP